MSKFYLALAIVGATLLTGCQTTGMVSSNVENAVSEKDKQECRSKAMGGGQLGQLFSSTFDGKVYASCLKEKAKQK